MTRILEGAVWGMGCLTVAGCSQRMSSTHVPEGSSDTHRPALVSAAAPVGAGGGAVPASSNEAPAAAPAEAPDAGVQAAPIAIDARKESAASSWQAVTELMARREAVDVTVWYDFGSARLRGRAMGPKYEVDFLTEIEMSERRYACSLDASTPWSLDLVVVDGKPRSSPPQELPKDMQGWCVLR
jgi:hypothetical protein